MTTLAWDQPGERFYETGIDRGVFYRPDGLGGYHNGVVWNGLTSVDEDLSDIVSSPMYFDGIKTSDLQSTGDFGAKLTAFTYPDEFLEYEGLAPVGSGLFADNQMPKMFGLSYRTLAENDLGSDPHAYKVHLIYNVTATPDAAAYASQADSISPTDFVWSLTAVPLDTSAYGYKPTAHFILDMRYFSPFERDYFENILYDNNNDPRMPTLEELLGFLARQIIIIAEPKKKYLPAWATPGDVAFAISDEGAYALDFASPDVREVIVIQGNDVALLPEDSHPGDVVYDETTGIIYLLGG